MVQRAHGGYRTSEGPESCMLVLGMLCLSAYAVQCAIAVVSPVSSNSGKPRVFVYDLPANITDGVPTQDDRQCDELASGSPNLLDCLFGTEFTVQTALGPLKLRKTDQHAIGRIFLWRIMGSANKVEHPNEADLFFVPFWYSVVPNTHNLSHVRGNVGSTAPLGCQHCGQTHLCESTCSSRRGCMPLLVGTPLAPRFADKSSGLQCACQ